MSFFFSTVVQFCTIVSGSPPSFTFLRLMRNSLPARTLIASGCRWIPGLLRQLNSWSLKERVRYAEADYISSRIDVNCNHGIARQEKNSLAFPVSPCFQRRFVPANSPRRARSHCSELAHVHNKIGQSIAA